MSVMTAYHYYWLQEEEGKQLVRDAIAAGIFNDLGSGSNVDVCVIRKGSVDYLRPFDQPNVKGKRLVLIHGLYAFHRIA
jgi:20S proteasome subunit beta 2